MEFLELCHQIVAHFVYILQQFFILNDVKHSLRRSTSKVVAAECCSQLSEDGGEFGAYEQCAHGEAVGDTFCHCDEVGAYACPLMGKEFSAAAVTALYFVEHKHCAGLCTCLLQLLQEFGLGNYDAADALYAFYDDCCNVAFCKFGANSLNVVEGQVCCVVVVVDGGNDFCIVCHLHCQRCTSVERFFE